MTIKIFGSDMEIFTESLLLGSFYNSLTGEMQFQLKMNIKSKLNVFQTWWIYVLLCLRGDYFIEQNGIQIKLVLIIFNQTGFKLNNVNLCDSMHG